MLPLREAERCVVMQAWLSEATAKASSCVRDLMANPGSLKRGAATIRPFGKVSKVFYSLLLSFNHWVSHPKNMRRCSQPPDVEL